MHNGPTARFYKAFAYNALMFAGSYGMGSAFAGANRSLGTAFADGMGIANTYTHWGTTRMRFTFGKDVFKYGPQNPSSTTFTTTLRTSSSEEVFNRMALNFTKSNGQREVLRPNYFVNQYEISGFYLEGTIGRQGATLGGGTQITPLNTVIRKGIVGKTQ